MNFPENLLYSKEHAWLQVDGQTGTIGITEFAQRELGEIVFVELPNVGQYFKADEIFGSVEAVKTTSDLFMPVTGKVTAVNQQLVQQPELVNNDPFGQAWMIRVELIEETEVKKLLIAATYRELTGI
nr:glycine cleavage system protein GcvH [uncultured Mucilaginibacter sp.]